ncbi:MAG: hypothetical protein ACRYG4_09235 [Janthinobacterium lividum]
MFSFQSRPALGFASVPIAGGHSWAWTSVVSVLLREAEARFGPRDMTYTFLGIEFTLGNIPQTWYPGACNHIAIQLTEDARLNPQRALFQLAHEIIHLLSPDMGHTAPTLEEGLASVFSAEISQRNGHPFHDGLASYERAAALTRQLLIHNSQAIKDIRTVEPRFRQITPDHILSAAPLFDKALAVELCAPFQR